MPHHATLDFVTRNSDGRELADDFPASDRVAEQLLSAFETRLSTGDWPQLWFQAELADWRNAGLWIRFESNSPAAGASGATALTTVCERGSRLNLRIFRSGCAGTHPARTAALARPMPAGSIFNLLPVRTPLELRDTAAPTVRRRRHRSRLSGNRFGGVAKSLAAAAGLDRASSDDAITRIADVSRQFFLGKGVPAEGLVIPAQSLRDLQQFSTLTIGQNWSAARVHPHGICVGIALRICGQQIVTDSGILTVRGKIAIPGRNPAGPYLFFGLCREVLGEWFITRAYAHPYVQGWLLVDSNSERSFYSELLSCLHNEGFTHVLIERPLFPDRDPVFFDFCLSIPGYPFRFWVEVLGTDFPGYVARKHQHARLLRSQGHLALMFPSYLPHRQRIQYFLQLRNELRQWVDRARRWRP